MKAFNSLNDKGRKLADLVEQYLKKGHQCYFEGHLVMETWDDKNGGGKRSKLVIVVDDLQFLEPRTDGGEGMSRAPRARSAVPAQPSMAGPAGGSRFSDDQPPADEPSAETGEHGDIPF